MNEYEQEDEHCQDEYQEESARRPYSIGLTIAIVTIVMPSVFFLPLALSAVEYAVFGTNYVEDFFRMVHLHDALGKLYEPVVEFVHRFVD